MRKRFRITVLFMGISTILCAQTASFPTSHAEALVIGPAKETAASTSREIKKERPEIPSRILAIDSEIIAQAQTAIQTKFKQAGFNNDDAYEASLAAWKIVRLNSRLQPGKPMHAESFVEFVTTSIGKVVFKSTPDKARVTVDNDPLGSTEVKRWYPSGTLSVLFEKDGFESITKTCGVTAPGFNECVAELKPKH